VSGTLVLVDDELSILKALFRELASWSQEHHYRILFFTSAREALAVMNENDGEVDLLVADLLMPDLSGSDLLRFVKEKWPDVPTILLTGLTDANEISRAARWGPHGFIPKPWEPGTLIEQFEEAMDLGGNVAIDHAGLPAGGTS
jgi:sigma-B regulation protein RsbU (phosphoserine phosphatase)